MDNPVPPQPPDLSSFEELASLCEEFTGEYQAAAPSLSAYLLRVRPEAQPPLFRNLLAIEIDRRRAAGESPRADEYLARFPQFGALIRDVFLDHSSLSSSASRDTANLKPRPGQAPAISRLGEYRLLGELGRGGMGVVYEAVHVQRGNRVALKTLPLAEGASLHRFKREFRALADSNHPNLVGLHTLEADGNQWFFTMDLVEGGNFLAHVRPGGTLDESRLRSALSQLATGVMALHARHIVHRDLKPPNVRVTPEGRVVLLDFGLVAEMDNASASGSTDRIAGTPRYMAPEQAAGQRVSPASDWYAVGVMLYEALSGKQPFVGPMMQVLLQKQTQDAPPLPDDPAIPADLAALAMRLLAREPRQRPDALEIARAIVAGTEAAPVSPTRSGGPQLVGREPHLAALHEAYRQIQRERQPVTTFISGRSGEGKSTLGEHFLAPLRKDDRLAVMSGRCYDRESVPFKALDSLIDALSVYLRSLSREDAALLMPDDVGVLSQVFPVLSRVEVVARAGGGRLTGVDEQQVRRRAFMALRSLLKRIGRRSLVVWFIDDLQWGDADSAEALFEVLRPPEAPAVLFLGAYRSDETEGSAFLTTWKELQRKHDVAFDDREVKLGPLSEEECVELVVGLVGRDGEAVRQRAVEFARETRGNPFLLVELVGCFDPDTNSFEPMPLHEVLAKKLGRLPEEAGGLLDVVAISGQALPLEDAARAAGHEQTPMATLTRMRNERLIRLVGSEESPLIDTYHDRVRETILTGLDEGRRQRLHRTLAEVIEARVGLVPAEILAAMEKDEKHEVAIPRVYDLAYHFDAAGDRPRALAYGLLAAEQARRQLSLDVARSQYAIARRNDAEVTNAIRYRIAEGFGEVLLILGRYQESREQLDGAIDLVQDVERQAGIEFLQGECAFKRGELKQGITLYEQALQRLGNWVPGSFLGLGYGIVRQALIQCWHRLLPGRLHRRPYSSEVDLTVRLFGRLSGFYTFTNSLKVLWAQLSGVNRGELIPPSPRLALCEVLAGSTISMLGWHSRGAIYSDRGLALARQFDDLWLQGQVTSYRGIGLCASARYEESMASLTEAIVSFEKAGDHWETNLAHFHHARCNFGLGNLAETVAEAKAIFAASARQGDSRTLCSSYLWARATRGNIPFDQLRGCLPSRPDDVMSTVHGTMAEGFWHSFHGRTSEALEKFEAAADMVRKSLCVNFHTIVVMPALAGALRQHADAVQSKDARECDRLRKRAHRVANRAAWITRLFPTVYPYSLRELSLILAARGKTKKAHKYAAKSCALAEKQKAKYEHAQSSLVAARLAKQLGLPNADEQILTAEAALDAIERPVRALSAS